MLYLIHIINSETSIKMKGIDHENDTIYLLTKAVEEGDPEASRKIKDHLNKIDLILIMSVEPGFGGQKFMPEVLPKLKELKKIIDKEKYNVDIEIDGGINFKNSKAAKEAGANILVSGSTVFNENGGDLKKNINLLREN